MRDIKKQMAKSKRAIARTMPPAEVQREAGVEIP